MLQILDENDQRRKEKEEEKVKERKKKFEKDLLETIINYNDKQNFEDIEKDITPNALTGCESRSLLMGMKVFILYNYSTIAPFYHIRAKERAKHAALLHCRTGQKY